MKLRELYQKALETAIKNDPRGEDAVRRELQARKKEFDDLKEKDREFFEEESLTNPYSDSRMLVGTGEEEITSALVGVDIEGPEVLLAQALRDKGRSVDLCIAHHPEGRAFANLHAVMKMQSDILAHMGVSVSTAEDLMEKRIGEIERRLMPANHTRAVDTARLLGIPFVCFHTFADNMVASYLQKKFDEEKPYRVSDIMDSLNELPEYRAARHVGAGPKVLLGSPKRTAGKVFVDMTGGTSGAKEIYESLSQTGVNTIVGMHINEDHKKEAEKAHVNVVIAGHISSDSLGINLLMDEIVRHKPVEILECSGFTRVSRL